MKVKQTRSVSRIAAEQPKVFSGLRLLLLIIAFIAASSSLFIFHSRAANPSSGSIGPSSPPVQWVGDVTGTGAELGEEQCIDSGPAKNCDSFALMVNGTEADWTSKVLQVRINWTLGANDYDVYIHKGDLTGPVAGKGPGGSPPGTEEIAYLDPHNSGVGLYTVHVAYAAVVPNSDQYHGTATPLPGVLPAVAGSGLAPRFQSFYPQPNLIKTGFGTDAGEPSVGVNWISNRAMYISALTTFRVTFDDSCPNTPVSTWENKSAPNSQESLDPILFTDHGYNNQTPETGRTIVSQLTGQDSLSAYTDDDGDTYVPSQGGGIPSGVDHQSIGAGPFHEPLVGTVHPHAVYYCSQDIVASAFCARSDDGGLTFGAGVPIYTTECVGIHGHIKVGPDGTVYVPNRDCNGNEAAVVSEDNGITWHVRPIPGTTSSDGDPAVAVGRGDVVKTSDNKPIGRLYEAFAGSNSTAGVAVSDDHGLTWKNSFDVGSLVGIKAIAFPTIVAGDDNRAAFAFLGSTTQGAPGDRAYPGLWHLYIGTTYDGGNTWLVSDATPNDPVQRNGIHLGGGSPPHRNLLDFIGIDIDKQGRVLVAYADGCTGAGCVQGSATTTGNSYTELAAIARQSGGRRMFAANDPAELTAPGAPLLTVGRDGNTAKLTWSESDNGGQVITNYAVLR
ncbi:MAG TPA: sialidase family protein, partial [Pyrinomonadaceae bacterium]|nr:sialidase family protein [Pyrinomonadaceae bacterium]